ncbi:MAG: hypothetical protein A2600_09445 [Candidatus Lambdaproteobacteria bacterium RIFOXYD1_FULL_56_27]|uniref:Uncharacterized protein n=1 Tax=Candidatus Lambdaproteobacteria bacterium RIFOXYD2_FULL_56_26 TaxID=1817773 RepID=A0A1F6GUR4_9PROT|nr:MAG: hypothetical protein A2557_04715 [Candidatus Lambdaproteobacteria bacterium RIFOXYD2_FULL_56_26]OGH02275.1 MAG: hypothetical protein A2426_03195 [Candidatus Lambdaproteobacteria bacterium RIFOXYC1_FULL_56_13]OGH10044.1 MAG: hypothetical protein A2600_09445 [Candidatus Lambdaproteobacteria bacterium RIFOXYD1_FULL_56_27]
MGLGALATGIAAYQLVKRGFLLWMLLVVIGISAINFGYTYARHTPLQAMINDLDPGALGDLPTKQLEKLCEKLGN